MKSEAKVPRPLNSYIIFRVQKQREIVEQCPGANHRDISKITSKWWRELSPKEKQPYVDEAERRKQEHKLMYPDYKFTPKKRSRSVRPYKKRPSNELIALNDENKRNLLALYHHGTVTDSKEQLVNQIEPTRPRMPKRVQRSQNTRSSFSEPPMSSFAGINPQLLYPLDTNPYGLSPSYSSTVSQSPYEYPMFEASPYYFYYQEQPNMYHFLPTDPIYPTTSTFGQDPFSPLKSTFYNENATLQPIQLLTRPFPS